MKSLSREGRDRLDRAISHLRDDDQNAVIELFTEHERLAELLQRLAKTETLEETARLLTEVFSVIKSK